MKIYLSARYGRIEELQGYARELGALGHTIVSRWVFNYDRKDTGINLQDVGTMYDRAGDNIDDISKCDVFVCFSEAPDSPHGRGGRHIETGYMIGNCGPKHMIIVGPRENVFHCLLFRQYDTFAQALACIEDWQTDIHPSTHFRS